MTNLVHRFIFLLFITFVFEIKKNNKNSLILNMCSLYIRVLLFYKFYSY